MPAKLRAAGRAALSTPRPVAYIAALVLAAIGTYAYTLRTEGIFACPGDGYDNDHFLAYCFSNQYGDYDHGAFWFNLEPAIQSAASSADVVFLGNSRMQFGFSGRTTDAWFQALPAQHYLMGFAYWENYTFQRELITRLRPRAKVYVVNIDPYFFDDKETPVANAVMHDDTSESHYKRKRLWQRIHRPLCGWLPGLCGRNTSFYRSRATGGYRALGGPVGVFPVSYDQSIDPIVLQHGVQRGALFFHALPVPRSCVLLTLVPSEKTNIGTARAIAAALGMTFIAPQTAGLDTWDHSHLERSSADRWAEDFLRAAEPDMRRCLHAADIARD